MGILNFFTTANAVENDTANIAGSCTAFLQGYSGTVEANTVSGEKNGGFWLEENYVHVDRVASAA